MSSCKVGCVSSRSVIAPVRMIIGRSVDLMHDTSRCRDVSLGSNGERVFNNGGVNWREACCKLIGFGLCTCWLSCTLCGPSSEYRLMSIVITGNTISGHFGMRQLIVTSFLMRSEEVLSRSYIRMGDLDSSKLRTTRDRDLRAERRQKSAAISIVLGER